MADEKEQKGSQGLLPAGMDVCRELIDAVGDQVLVIDERHTVAMVNRSFLEQTGLEEHEVLGRRCHELTHRSPIPCSERGEQCPLTEVFATGAHCRVSHLHFDGGGQRHVDLIGSPLRDERGRVIAMVETIRDVTRQKQLDAELRQRNAELEEAHRRREEFTSTITHELKNVLNVLGLNAQLLEKKALDEAERRHARLVLDQLRRLTRLVGDMSDASAIETQRFSLRKARCDLAAIVTQSVEAHQSSTERHTIQVEAPAGPIEGEWDCERLRQVVDNLISNAIKYSPSGGAIRVTVTASEREARVSVADDGVGIPAERLPFLFKPYARAHREITGLGLGLFVSKGIVETHGGRISVRSEEHRGTELVFTLPL